MSIQKLLPVRVWCGYRLHSMDIDKFETLLGTVFIPACVEMQTKLGLTAYVPTVLSGLSGKDDSIPDETALVFYKSQKEYKGDFETLAERIYALDHHGVFSFDKTEKDFKSYSDFPAPFTGSLKFKSPVYLFANDADWMHGKVTHFVGTRPSNMEPNKFQEIISKILTKIQENIKLDGAIACLDENYLVYWELVTKEQGDNDSPTGISLLDEVFTEWKQTFTAKPTSLPKGLWEHWEGMNGNDPLPSGSSFNLVFDRETSDE